MNEIASRCSLGGGDVVRRTERKRLSRSWHKAQMKHSAAPDRGPSRFFKNVD